MRCDQNALSSKAFRQRSTWPTEPSSLLERRDAGQTSATARSRVRVWAGSALLRMSEHARYITRLRIV